MNLEAELQGIVRENEGDLLGFARKLYEHGYRQGLASRPQGQVEPEAASPAPIPPPPIPPPHGPLFPSRPKLVAVADEDNDEPEDSDVPPDDEEIATCDHRVRASITVAGLQRKIERLFDLSRFGIEVVICRRGDPDRRRLKGGVKLRNYLLESE
jgi:hypothetical protein